MEPKTTDKKKVIKNTIKPDNLNIEEERKIQEDIPEEDVSMLREKDSHQAYSQYDDDNSFGDDR